jgi:hypothetical protein
VNEYFALFDSLCEGSRIHITEATRAFLLSLSRDFGDSDISLSILNYFHSSYPLDQIYDHFGEASIPFLASEFHKLKSSELANIPLSALYDILSHHQLKILSEDSLYWSLSSRICSDLEYWELLQFIRFEYLSPECICDFVSVIREGTCISHHLWETISPRLISGLGVVGLAFPLEEAKSLNGMIRYLTRKHGGNVHDKGIVTITSKSVDQAGSKNFSYLAALTSGNSFISKDEPDQWICWDFHDLRTRPTHYTITSGSLKSWVVESSLDGEAWTEIDRRTDTMDFKVGWEASFAVSNSAECRFIRLTQTGKNHKGNDHLIICAFEFFGALIE